MALWKAASIWALTIASGSGTSTRSSSDSSAVSRIFSAWWIRLTRRTCSLRSARRSSRVSNSLAIWANSSSASGSSRSLTDLTVTVTSAGSPARSPATSVVVKVAEAPSASPTMASSSPSIRRPEPTSCDNPSALASGMSSPSMAAVRSIETKSPSCTARSTAFSVPNRARSASSSASTSASATSIGSTVIVSALRSGRSISGRTSTSAVNTSSSPSSILVTSMSGSPIGRTSVVVTASL